MSIKYRDGYKYQLEEDYCFQTNITGHTGGNSFVHIAADGMLNVYVGYAWDGPSGPTIDTENSKRPSMIHDALYQLMRMKILPQICRKRADDILYEELVKNGMLRLRAWIWYKAVRNLAAPFADPAHAKPLIEAP